MRRRVAVIGGGLAGITAALRCADAGVEVTLLEARPRLGGLTYSFPRGTLQVDNGQHVFLRCCTSYRALLDRLGVAGQVVLQPRLDIPVLSPGQRPARLYRTSLPAPFHLGAALSRYSVLSPTDRLRAVRAALALRGVDPADPATDRQSFGAWLSEHGQNAPTTAALWELIAVATLNARADDASLALAAMVLQQGLLTDRGAGDLGWSRVPLQQLHGDAAQSCLRRAGADVRTGVKVTGVRRDGTAWIVNVSGDTAVVADQVVLAVPPSPAHALAPPGSIVAPDGWAQGLGSSPIVNVHVIFDRQVLAEPFVAGLHTPVQWVFDRTDPAGLTGSGAQYLAISLSAAHNTIDMTAEQVRRRILPALRALLPAAGRAQLLDSFVTKARHATFNPAPGTAALRPAARTRLPDLVLAGAWTATGWPATMESAVRSGDAAAETLLHAGTPAAAEGVRAA